MEYVVDPIEQRIIEVHARQEAQNERLSSISDNLGSLKTDLSDHVQSTDNKFNTIDREMHDLRTEQVVMVHEVKDAVKGLERIANRVGDFYEEFKDDRSEQMGMITANNTFRDRLLGGVGVLTLVGTILTVVLNLDALSNLL